jgi:hypothetical protein
VLDSARTRCGAVLERARTFDKATYELTYSRPMDRSPMIEGGVIAHFRLMMTWRVAHSLRRSCPAPSWRHCCPLRARCAVRRRRAWPPRGVAPVAPLPAARRAPPQTGSPPALKKPTPGAGCVCIPRLMRPAALQMPRRSPAAVSCRAFPAGAAAVRRAVARLQRRRRAVRRGLRRECVPDGHEALRGSAGALLGSGRGLRRRPRQLLLRAPGRAAIGLRRRGIRWRRSARGARRARSAWRRLGRTALGLTAALAAPRGRHVTAVRQRLPHGRPRGAARRPGVSLLLPVSSAVGERIRCHGAWLHDARAARCHRAGDGPRGGCRARRGGAAGAPRTQATGKRKQR